MPNKTTSKTEEVKSLNFKNGQIRLLYSWLTKNIQGQPVLLHGQQSRARNRFVSLIGPRVEEIEKERIRIAEALAEKDKDDKPKKNEQGNYIIKDMDTFIKEYQEVLNEDFIVDILPSNKDTLNTIKDFVLTMDYEFGPDEDKVYDTICTIFEESL